MTPEYRARREAKHAAQAASKPPVLGGFVQTIDLTPPMAKHAFVGLKSQKRADGGRKNRSGYAQEHVQANIENAARMIKKLAENPAVVAELAEQGKAIDLNEVEKSIGGISETEGVPTAVTAVIGSYHDFIAMNANECVFDPTPEDCDRILRESAIEIRKEDGQ